MIIDMHSHVIPEGFIEEARGKGRLGAHLKENDGKTRIEFETGALHPYEDVFFDMEARKKELNHDNIDMQGIAVAPALFYYDFPDETAIKKAILCNDGLNDIVKNDADRFFAVGTVPLQNPSASVKELKRIHDEYGFKSIQIGTDINGKGVATDDLIPFYAEVEKLDMTILMHPFPYGRYRFLEDYYLINYLGNTLSTTIAASHLIFSGMLEKFPGLRVVLVHGGGYLPYQIMRLDHGYDERPESRVNITKKPSYFFGKNMYFDTILHDPRRTRLLIDLVGSDKVMLGSDYPYDMEDHNPFSTISSIGLGEKEFSNVSEQNARKLFL
jgi:aminocarboxymuconate-semialdehyde decarboxylase